MPPFVVRKRQRSSSPAADQPPAKRPTRTPTSASKSKKKPTLFEAVDAKPTSKHTVEDNKKYLAELNADDEEEEEFSDVSSDEFEDVMPSSAATRHKVAKAEHEDEEDEDGMGWEDAIGEGSSTLVERPPSISGDLELTLDAVPTNTLASITNPHGTKKGPSKIERQIRLNTHCIHVQYLLFHNLIRNGWACDKEAQKVLVAGLAPGVKREVERWRKACGDVGVDHVDGQAQDEMSTGDVRRKDKGKQKDGKSSKAHKNQRDWGNSADLTEAGAPNLSHGDPTLRLLKFLCAFWRKRFTVTAPGLRKQGYKDLPRLEEEVKSHRNDPYNVEEHGERIKGVSGFRKLAKRCEGSRDVGAQLFTALLRGLGLETRLVANLQPVGFGWSKSEDANPKKQRKAGTKASDVVPQDSESDVDSQEEVKKHAANLPRPRSPVTPRRKQAATAKKTSKAKPSAKGGGGKDEPIALSDDDSELSSAPSSDGGRDDDSVIELEMTTPVRSSKKYDRDLPFPNYWTEVLSPISNTWIPVDPIVLSVVASNAEGLVSFEPRGAKADRAKQVLAYVVAYSSDGTAKDVTVRYLKRHMWPGKTKGARIPAEKVPVHNKRGKVLRYEDYDWFKTVMACYTRSSKQRTKADRIEEDRELKPVRVVREIKAGGAETLQGYKTSAEFALEIHLRREEALLPGAQSVKIFKTGKGDKAMEQKVFLRKDVVVCRTVESWHKEGRETKIGVEPLKHVPVRAVTTIRKREIEEVQRETGEKMLQPLYSREQTDWIIPPPIVNGVIPKNAFNNIDVYVPTMVPRGAVHIRLKGTARVCKKLGIDFAEACTGFEFGNRRAVPVLTGVVVARENEGAVRDAWRVEEAEKRKKEIAKREKLALGMWKKMLAGLRIVERVRKEYGDQAESHIQEAIHPMATKKKGKGKAVQSTKLTRQPDQSAVDLAMDDVEGPDMNGTDYTGGGFIPDGTASDVDGGGFLRSDVEEGGGFVPEGTGSPDRGGGFILEDDTATSKLLSTSTSAYPRTPVSLQSLHQPGSADEDELGQDSDDHDESQLSRPVKAVPRKRGRTSTGTKKSAPTRAAPTRKRAKVASRSIAVLDDADMNDTMAVEDENESLPTPGEDVVSPPPTKQRGCPPRISAVRNALVNGSAGTRRNAGRKSKDGVRSRYFVGDSAGEDTDAPRSEDVDMIGDDVDD